MVFIFVLMIYIVCVMICIVFEVYIVFLMFCIVVICCYSFAIVLYSYFDGLYRLF